MLKYYFWLLEFEFMFEFICLNPFSKNQTYLSPPSPFLPFLLFQPISQSSLEALLLLRAAHSSPA
jgi:hypothetical protein